MSKRMSEREYWPKDEKRPELKPCPFCGGEAIEITKWLPYERRRVTVVRCKECRANSGIWKIKKKASEHWNRRKKE